MLIHLTPVRKPLRRNAVLIGSAVGGAVAGLLLGVGAAPWQALLRPLGRAGGPLSPGWWWDRTLALQSTGLLVLVVLAALAGVLLVARAGRTVPAPGAGQDGGRRRRVLTAGLLAGQLLACQLLGALAVGLVVNRSFDFYSSWDDLLGLGAGALQVRGAGASGAVPLADRRFAVPDPGAGRVVDVTVPGARTGLSEQVAVYLPPQYDRPGAATRRFPVTLALTGYPGALHSLEGPVAIPATMHTLLARGRVAPMVVVMAMSAVTPPRDTECTDVPGGPQVQTYFAQDLPTWVSEHFRVARPGSWGVLGVSTGGFCAAKLVLSHPEVFRAAVSLSGTLTAATDITTGDLFGGSLVVRHENDPYWRITHLPPPPVSLMLTATRQEHGVYPQVVRFLRAARPPLQTASIIRPTGGHNAGVWRSELPLCLQWLSARLPAVGPATGPS